jgi:hypothetical protein
MKCHSNKGILFINCEFTSYCHTKKLKRNWVFSNLVISCKIHLFNNNQLMRFLEIPEKDWIIEKEEIR